MTNKTNISRLFGVALIAAAVTLLALYASQAHAGISSVSSYPCTVVTSTSTLVGSQVSTTILATSSRRAWARIEQPVNATNTIAISIAGAAVIGQGVQLTPATSTSPVAFFDFGLNTDLPYTGTIQAIASTASTSVAVSQCVY